jgi:hypothetical protein
MLPLQEIEIKTNKGRLFHVHLEKGSNKNFKCKLAAIKLGAHTPADATFEPFSKGETAQIAFSELIKCLSKSLINSDPEDSITKVNNPCNTEFITKEEQKTILKSDVTITVND